MYLEIGQFHCFFLSTKKNCASLKAKSKSMPSKENGEIIVNWKKIVIDEYKKINKKNEQLAKKLWNQNR